jgi:hypothetical protein
VTDSVPEPEEGERVAVRWARSGEVSDDTGLWCFGCGKRYGIKGTQPTRWIETICPHEDCWANNRV